MRKRWIIGGVGLVVLLAAGYTGYWFWLAQTFQQNLALWVEQQRSMGYQIAYASSEPGGYPLSIHIALSQVVIESPPGQTPWRLSTASKSLNIAPWAPLSLRIVDGDERAVCSLQWAAAGRDYGLSIDGMDIAIRLSTEGDLPVIRISGKSAGVTEQGREIAGLIQPSGSLDLLQATSDTQSSAEFLLSADGIDFVPPTQSNSKTVETYDWLVAGQIKGPVPLAPLPAALAAWSSEGGHVELTQFNANWEATTTVSGDGTVALDQRLQPVGAFSAVVRGYNEAVDAAVARGVMTSSDGIAVKLWLNARAEKDERGFKVKLPLTIQDGFVSMGPIKLAQVPRIAWD
jgi:Uncharacterized protein conserved in bacteria (DUF2125)